jgi:uncharacterized membrane protein
MVYAGLVFAGLAALLHVYIFVMESLTWTSARTRATFGISEEEALATKELAFNQGFYNLFLAIEISNLSDNVARHEHDTGPICHQNPCRGATFAMRA